MVEFSEQGGFFDAVEGMGDPPGILRSGSGAGGLEGRSGGSPVVLCYQVQDKLVCVVCGKVDFVKAPVRPGGRVTTRTYSVKCHPSCSDKEARSGVPEANEPPREPEGVPPRNSRRG